MVSPQKQAENEGREVVRRDKGEFFLHEGHGQIGERDSHGNDPLSPSGRTVRNHLITHKGSPAEDFYKKNGQTVSPEDIVMFQEW
jgi:hypothetical protein